MVMVVRDGAVEWAQGGRRPRVPPEACVVTTKSPPSSRPNRHVSCAAAAAREAASWGAGVPRVQGVRHRPRSHPLSSRSSPMSAATKPDDCRVEDG